MKQRLFLAAFGAGALGLLTGCAKPTPVDGAPTPSTSANAEAPAGARWTANIQSVTQNRGQVAAASRDRSYGSATWTHGAAPSLTSVNLVFTHAGLERTLAWAILPGSCGSPALPMIPMSNFPELNIGGGGRAQVETSLPLEFPTAGTYHINVYRDRRQGLDSLIACGNLRLGRG